MSGDLQIVELALREHFGQPPVRASVSFVGVEPIEVLRFEPVPDEVAYLSLGMSRHPMTSAAESVRTAEGPRAELMLHVRATSRGVDEAWRRLAVLAAAPVVEAVVYVPDMTVDLGEPLAAGSRCTGVVVTGSPLAAIETEAGPVDILQVLPATSTELAWARVHGTPALRERWNEQHCELLDLGRRAVPLD
ncbi:MAG: hypothetical protein QOG80_2687 [Pseudonocardiales bacterium]|nr:hypothetical protein [Pseudonocardiales bacterium]